MATLTTAAVTSQQSEAFRIGLVGYTERLEKAVIAAASFLQQTSYVDLISGKPNYSVRTVLLGNPDPCNQDVYLTPEGTFLVGTYNGIFASELITWQHMTPQQLLNYVLKTAEMQGGSAAPSILPLERLLEHFVQEMELLPKCVTT